MSKQGQNIANSGRVDGSYASETLNFGLISGQVKPKIVKIGIHSFPAWYSAI